MSCPLADSSTGPRKPRANAPAPPARRAAMSSSKGPFRKPLSCCCGTIRQPRPLSPAGRTTRGRAQRSRASRTNEPGRSLPCANALRCALGRRASTGKGAERMSRTPHWTSPGSAWDGVRRYSPCVKERGGAHRLLSPDPWAVAWTSAPALKLRRTALPLSGCSPAPTPGSHGHTHGVELPLCLGQDAGTDRFRGRRGAPPRFSARASAMATEPPYGCGADTGCPSLDRETTSEPVARDRRRQDQCRGKKAKIPLLGRVCLLTTGILIRVRRAASTSLRCAVPPIPWPMPLMGYGGNPNLVCKFQVEYGIRKPRDETLVKARLIMPGEPLWMLLNTANDTLNFPLQVVAEPWTLLLIVRDGHAEFRHSIEMKNDGLHADCARSSANTWVAGVPTTLPL
jgi:hypothetical protein